MTNYLKWNTVLLAIILVYSVGIYLFYLAFIFQDNTTGKFNPGENPFHSKMRFKDEDQKQLYKNQWFPTQSEQLIFQVIDGFYFPWVINQEVQQKKAQQKEQGIPSTYNLDVPFNQPIFHLMNEPNNTILMEGYADGPTMSAIRIKAILRGNMPLHIELLNNIKGVVMPDDNIIYQTKINGQNKKVLFSGFLYWDDFVGQHFDRKILTDQAALSKAIEDDQSIFDSVIKEQDNFDWGSMFCHYEAIDMAVHGYASVGPNTYPAVAFHNDLLNKLVESTKKPNILNQTIIYMSDHGQNEKHRAQHGGYSDLEKQVIVFGYDKRGFIQKSDRDIGQIMDREFLLSPKINQIDMSATYCMLRGIPLPSLNIGIIIPDFFINRADVDNSVIVNNYFVNVHQIMQYLTILKDEKKKSIQAFSSLQADILEITNLYNQLFDQQESQGNMDNSNVKEYVNNCVSFGRKVKKVFEEEITGPNLQNTKYCTVFFYIISLSAIVFASRISNVIYYPEGEASSTEAEAKLQQRDINKKYFKLGMIVVTLIITLMGYFLPSQVGFLMFYISSLALIAYFLRVQLRETTIKALILPLKVSNSRFYGLIDSFFILLGVAFNSVLRITNDFFEITYDLTQVFILIYYSAWLLMTLCSRKIGILKKLLTFGLLALVPTLTYECGYHSPFLTQQNQIFIVEEYKQYFQSVFTRFYYPMALLAVIYVFLIYKSTMVIQGNRYEIKRAIFAALCTTQLYLLLAFYYYQSNVIEPINGKEDYYPPVNYQFLSYIALFVIELYKIIFINRDPISPPNFSWKYATFLMNFYLQALFVLHYDGILKYCVLLIIIFLVGHIHNSLKIMQWGSKYVFLFLLSGWFFYVSDHMERINGLHVDVLNAGALFDGFFYPLLNGTLNTFFGQFAVALTVPLFVLAEQYQSNEEIIEEQSQTSRSFLNIIFSNRAELNFFRKKQENEGYSIQRDNYLKMIKNEGVSQEYENKNIRAYLYFLLPLLFSFSIAVMRNTIKPFDYFINKYYIPSFFFQVSFLGVIVVVFFIQYLLIRFHNTTPRRTLVDYNQMDNEEIEREFELQNDINQNIEP